MIIPKPRFIGGETGAWLGYWGNIVGSFLGILGAYSVMQYQLKKEDLRRKKAKNPILVVGISNRFNVKIYKRKKQDDPSLKIPLINGGNSPTFNLLIRFSYSEKQLIGLEELSTKVFKENPKLPDFQAKEIGQFHYFYDKDEQTAWFSDYRINGLSGINCNESYEENLSVIMPGQIEYITLPEKYLELVYYYIVRTFAVYASNKKVSAGLNPILNMKVSYQDYELKNREVIFKINADSFNVGDISSVNQAIGFKSVGVVSS